MKNTFILFVLACLIASNLSFTTSAIAQKTESTIAALNTETPLLFYAALPESQVYKYGDNGSQYTTWEQKPWGEAWPIGTFYDKPALATFVRHLAEKAEIMTSNADSLKMGDSIIITTDAYTCIVTSHNHHMHNKIEYYKYQLIVPGTEPYSFEWWQDYTSEQVTYLSLSYRRNAPTGNKLVVLDKALVSFANNINTHNYYLHKINH